MFLQRSSQSIVTEPRLTATPLVGGGTSGVRQPALVPAVSRSETAIASTFPTISRTQSVYQRRDQDNVTESLLTATPLMGGGAEWSAAASPGPGGLQLHSYWCHRLFCNVSEGPAVKNVADMEPQPRIYIRTSGGGDPGY